MTKLDEISQLINDIEVKKLQLMMKLEQDQKLYVQQIPKIQREMTLIKDEISKFQRALDSKPKITTKEVFQDLIKLDKVLVRMKETKSLLKDADNWNTVQMEVESLLVSKNYSKAASRLEEARKSLEMLSVAQNVDSRTALLDSLNKQFVELIKNEFRNSMDSSNFVEAKNLIVVFEEFHKIDEIFNYYCSLRTTSLLLEWKSNYTGKDGIVGYLEKLWDGLVTEFDNLEKIFSNPTVLLNKFFYFIISNLEPSFDLALENISKSKHAILELLMVYHSCVHFGAKMEQSYPCSKKENLWGSFLFGKFVPYQKRFEFYERQVLDSRLADFMKNGDLSGISGSFFDILYQSLSRYNEFTFGLVSVHLDELYDDLICKVANHMKSSIEPTAPSTKPIDSSVTVLQANMFIVPDDYEAMFQQKIANLKACVEFWNGNDTFWKTLKENPDQISEILGRNLCKSNLVPLKELHRDFHVHEQSGLKIVDVLNQVIGLAQKSVLESLLAPIRSFLGHLPHLQVWKTDATDNVDKFSLSPSAYITCVGEHLLTLPHLFDPYVQEDSLMFSIQTLPRYDPSEFGDDEDFTFAWIFSAIKLTERMLLDQLFLVRNLTTQGSKQMIADLEYLQNVMAALEIKSDTDLDGILDLITKDADELMGRTDKLGQLVRTMRGI